MHPCTIQRDLSLRTLTWNVHLNFMTYNLALARLRTTKSFSDFQADNPEQIQYSIQTSRLCIDKPMAGDAQSLTVILPWPRGVPCFEETQRCDVLLRQNGKLCQNNQMLPKVEQLLMLQGLVGIWPLQSCQWGALRKGCVVQGNSLLVRMLHWTEVHVTSKQKELDVPLLANWISHLKCKQEARTGKWSWGKKTSGCECHWCRRVSCLRCGCGCLRSDCSGDTGRCGSLGGSNLMHSVAKSWTRFRASNQLEASLLEQDLFAAMPVKPLAIEWSWDKHSCSSSWGSSCGACSGLAGRGVGGSLPPLLSQAFKTWGGQKFGQLCLWAKWP